MRTLTELGLLDENRRVFIYPTRENPRKGRPESNAERISRSMEALR